MKPFWQSKNFWHNVIALMSTLFVSAQAQEIINATSGLVDALFAEKIAITQIILALITIANVVWHIVRGKKVDRQVTDEFKQRIIEEYVQQIKDVNNRPR